MPFASRNSFADSDSSMTNKAKSRRFSEVSKSLRKLAFLVVKLGTWDAV